MPLFVDGRGDAGHVRAVAVLVLRPRRAVAPSETTMSVPATSFELRSGWPRSTPVSTTAIVAPAPRAPRAHASGALIWSSAHCFAKSGSFTGPLPGAPPVSYE